jgi:hypothetical protein
MDDFAENLQHYIVNPTNQVNLGWSVISIFYIGSFIIGLLLLGILGALLILQPPGDKSQELILGYVGLGLVAFGFYMTINNFNRLVQGIDRDILRKGEKSLFGKDTARSALLLAALNSNEIFQERIQKTRSVIEKSLSDDTDNSAEIENALKIFNTSSQSRQPMQSYQSKPWERRPRSYSSIQQASPQIDPNQVDQNALDRLIGSLQIT